MGITYGAFVFLLAGAFGGWAVARWFNWASTSQYRFGLWTAGLAVLGVGGWHVNILGSSSAADPAVESLRAFVVVTATHWHWRTAASWVALGYQSAVGQAAKWLGAVALTVIYSITMTVFAVRPIIAPPEVAGVRCGLASAFLGLIGLFAFAVLSVLIWFMAEHSRPRPLTYQLADQRPRDK